MCFAKSSNGFKCSVALQSKTASQLLYALKKGLIFFKAEMVNWKNTAQHHRLSVCARALMTPNF